MELFFEVLHVYSNSLVLLLVIIVNISFAGYSGFEWLKLKHMTELLNALQLKVITLKFLKHQLL